MVAVEIEGAKADMRALVLGGSGYVGRKLLEILGEGRGIGTGHAHAKPGLVAFNAVQQRLSDLLEVLPGTFTHVFVCYGLVNPDQCARDPSGTAIINVESMIRVLSDAQSAGLIPIFLSTDYVYDGTRGLRREDEPQSPTTEYGRQKAAVEQWLQERPKQWMIARLSKVVGSETTIHSVLGQWVNDIRAGKPLRSATDQIFSPARVDDIARALIELAERDERGIVHVAGSPLSRYDLNRLLVEAIKDIDPSVRRPSNLAGWARSPLRKFVRLIRRCRQRDWKQFYRGSFNQWPISQLKLPDCISQHPPEASAALSHLATVSSSLAIQRGLAHNLRTSRPDEKRNISMFWTDMSNRIYEIRCVDGKKGYAVSEDLMLSLVRAMLETIEVDEDWYLERYPDVRADVQAGRLKNAREHFIRHGYFEQRLPRRLDFDEAWYLAQNGDVAEAVAKGSLPGPISKHGARRRAPAVRKFQLLPYFRMKFMHMPLCRA